MVLNLSIVDQNIVVLRSKSGEKTHELEIPSEILWIFYGKLCSFILKDLEFKSLITPEAQNEHFISSLITKNIQHPTKCQKHINIPTLTT